MHAYLTVLILIVVFTAVQHRQLPRQSVKTRMRSVRCKRTTSRLLAAIKGAVR